MTLDEAIIHLQDYLQNHDFGCDECKNEHEQLLKWLLELKETREKSLIATDAVPVVHGYWEWDKAEMRLVNIEPFDNMDGYVEYTYPNHGGETITGHISTKDIHTIYAVPIVHCKYCKYHDGNTPGQPNILCYQMHDDDFCSYGEPKEGNKT